MAALINPCDIEETSGLNTGVECSSALGLAKGFYLVSSSYSWSASAMADPDSFFKTGIHADGALRFYPVLKGIFDFTLATESDVTETNNITGTTERLRAGGLTLTYTFKDGGMCLAKALKAFGKNYAVIFLDNKGQFLLRKNSDGTYSGLKTDNIASSISPTSAQSTFKNIVVFSVGQDEYIQYSELKKTSGDISDFNGLVDVEITKAAAASTTKLKISVATHCAKTDLLSLYGSAMADLDLYIVKNKATGVVVTPTSAAIVNGILELTGTYTTGQTYTVTGSAPSVWKTNSVEFYDASGSTVDHLIP